MHKLMQKTVLRHMLNLVAQGRLSADEVLERMSFETARETLHGLVLDPQRELRAGLGEVVFAQGKTGRRSAGRRGRAVSPRSGTGQPSFRNAGRTVARAFPAGLSWPQARLFALGAVPRMEANLTPPWPHQGEIMVVSAGAADIPVALEAFGALCFWGHDCGCVTDVGCGRTHA